MVTWGARVWRRGSRVMLAYFSVIGCVNSHLTQREWSDRVVGVTRASSGNVGRSHVGVSHVYGNVTQ